MDVFELIRKKLEEHSSKAEQNMNYYDELALEDASYIAAADMSKKKYETYCKVIDIVNQLAEEYSVTENDQDLMIVESLPSLYPMMQPFEEEAIYRVVGRAKNAHTDWIPCSSGKLPEEPEKKINSIDDAQEAARLGSIKEYCVMIKDAELPTVLCYAGDGYWYDAVTNDWYSVIAWRELPEPYIG